MLLSVIDNQAPRKSVKGIVNLNSTIDILVLIKNNHDFLLLSSNYIPLKKITYNGNITHHDGRNCVKVGTFFILPHKIQVHFIY